MRPSTRLPYPGLRPFLRDESDLFFGREGCVDEMVDRLKATRFLAVLGASGSGKSSLVATGLLDALELGLLANAGSRWQIAHLRPGGEPMRNLAAALAGSGDEQPTHADFPREIELLTSFLRRGPRSIAQWCLDGNLKRGCNLLILVDQFEELFRYGNYAGREEAEAFVALLIASAQADDVPIYIVITMRSEYLGACALIPGFAERINAGLYLTPRMTREQVREAIEGPARVCGFTIEPALVNRLLNDLSSFAPWENDASDDELERLSRRSDQLPLMQHVLNRLWLRADQPADGGPGRLRLWEDEQLGGLRGALDAHAREVFESLPDGDRPILELVFRALISGTSLADAVRRPCRYGELVDLAQGNRAAVDRVVQAFRADDCNFLTPPAGVALDDRTVVDISHESLIRQWSLLSDWLEKEVRAAAFWRRLVAAAVSYDHGEGDLLRGADLAYFVASWMRESPTAAWAQRHGNLFAQAKQFLDCSKAAEIDQTASERRRLRRSRAMFAGLSGIIFGLLVLALVSWYEAQKSWHEAQNAADKANKGFGLAIRAAASLGENAGTSGSNIHAVMENADRMLEGVAEANSPSVVEQRAALLLRFASTSARLGDYSGQNERVMKARSMLLPICEQTQAPSSCMSLLAWTYDVEGNYLAKVGKQQEAVAAYEQALETRKRQGAVEELVLAQAGTQAALSGALFATGRPEDGLGVAMECSETLKRISPDSGPAQFAKATCELREAEGLQARGKTVDALGKAKGALSLLDALLQNLPYDDRHVEQAARVRKQLALSYRELRDRTNAMIQLDSAVRDLKSVARSNPQNDQVADLLAELFSLQATAYGVMGRNDRAAEAWEERVKLSKNQRGGPRSSHWRGIERDSLNNLHFRYAALKRYREALETAEAEIQLRLEEMNQQPDEALYPAPLLSVMLSAAEYATEISEGTKAFEWFSRAFAHAKRHLMQLHEARRNPETEYTPFSTTVYRAVVGLSEVQHQMVPKGDRVAVLTRIVDIIASTAADEPRIIPFRIAEGRSRNELAKAFEIGGDVKRSREMHELASKAGSRDSTIVLLRSYLEGLGGTLSDQQRARELETLAANQGNPPTLRIEVRSRADGAMRWQYVYFREPGDGDPLADEAYRFARYRDAEFTDASRKFAMDIYKSAREQKLTVARLIDEYTSYAQQATDLPDTTVSADVNRAREALEKKQVEDAYKLIIVAKGRLESKVTEPSNVKAWGVIADVSAELARAPETARDPQLAVRVRRLRDEAHANIFAPDPDGSSPRMALAADLMQLEPRARKTKDYDYAVRLHRRAIDLRNMVRERDPSNADCDCLIAANYRSIGQIEIARENFDAAVVSFQRALLIYEDLVGREPNTKNWSRLLAVTARELAEVLGKRGDSKSAFVHADNAVRITREFAERYSADSETRMNYAKSLELVASLAHNVANRDPESSDSYFKLAVANLVDANAIRESILVVDPNKGECRCQVGSNHIGLANIYRDWGKTAERLEAFNRAVQVYRELMQTEPEYRPWRYFLARSLSMRAGAISEQSKDNHEVVLADYREASTLLRDLEKGSLSKNTKEMLVDSLTGISFNALFVARDEEALAAADEALKLSPGDLRIALNKAHALMYLERGDEALRIYQEHKGKPLLSETWEKSIAEHFAELKAARGAHPLMDRLLKEMGIEPTHVNKVRAE